MGLGAINPNVSIGSTQQAATQQQAANGASGKFPDPANLTPLPKPNARHHGAHGFDARIAKLERLLGPHADISFGALRFRLKADDMAAETRSPELPGWDGESRAPNPATTPAPGQRLDVLK